MKKSIKRFLAAATAACIAAVSLSACNNNANNASSAAAGSATAAQGAKGKVYYLNFKPEQADQFKAIAEAYTKESGVPVSVVTAAAGTYEQTLKSEMAKSEAPTIFITNGPVGYETWKEYCADLSDTELNKQLSLPQYALKDGDKVVGLPLAVEGYGIVYNQAIMDKYFKLAGAKAKNMDEVNSFAKLKEVAEDMTAKKGQLGIKGVFASTSLKSGEDWRWQTHLANIPVAYELEENKTPIDANVKEIAFKYGKEFQNLFDLYLNNSITDKKMVGGKSVGDSTAEFALGQVAMVQNGNWVWSDISKTDGCVVEEGDVKYLPMYTGHSGEEKQGLAIGTENFACINKKAPEADQKASADFLAWLYTGKGMEYVTKSPTDGGLGFIAPYKSFGDTAPDDPLAKQVIAWQNKDGIQTVPWDFVTFPSQEFKNQFGANLLKYAQGGMSWSDVEKAVVSGWKSEAAK